MAADGRRHVLAIGGRRGPGAGGADRAAGPSGAAGQGVPPLFAHALALSGRAAPRVCLLNTAMGDDAASFLQLYSLLSGAQARVSHLQLFPMPNVADPGDLLLSQDVILVGGGSVANMLAVWRTHELDRVMRAAWQAGIVLAGVSAGAICWFEGGTTDSFGPVLRPFTGGLALLAGSYCPHYSSEPARRPLYQALVADGTLPPGIACDDGTAAHFADDALAEIVADRPGALGYRVGRAPGGRGTEVPLPTRVLEAGGR
jgi:peptidase E